MKISIIILILSGVLFFSGIASAAYYSYSLFEKYPDLQTMYQGELEGGQQITTPINATKGKNLTVTVFSDNRNNLFFYIEDGKQDVVIESIFRETISYPLLVNQSGVHIIGIGNMGDTSSMIGGFVTEYPIIETEFEELGNKTIISYSLIFISIILFLIGLVMYFVQRKRNPSYKENSFLD